MAQLNDLLTNISNIKNDMKQAIINKGQTVTNFASYPNAILNIQSGGSGDEGDIKLFETVEELNNDPNPSTDKLACVYTEGNLTNFYEYKTGLINKDIIAFHSLNDAIVTVDEYENVIVSFNPTTSLKEVPAISLCTIASEILKLFDISSGNPGVAFYIDSNNNLKAFVFCHYVDNKMYSPTYLHNYVYNYDFEEKTITSFRGICQTNWNSTSFGDNFELIIYDIDLNNLTFTENIINKNWITYTTGCCGIEDLDIQSFLICFNASSIINGTETFGYITLTNNFYRNYKDLSNAVKYKQYNGYVPISLSMTADKEYVTENKFLGKNGVEEGILQNNINLTKDQVRLKTNIWNDISNLELDSNVTNISNIFANRIDLIEIPNINLMNITNMENTFYNCVNLNDRAYFTLTNILPNANQLTNQYLTNIGLNISKFSNNQLNTLNSKGYIDAIPVEPVGKLTYYNIYYNTNDEVADDGEEF